MSEPRIAVVLYERRTLLDAAGPKEVLRFLPEALELGRPRGAIPELWEAPA